MFIVISFVIRFPLLLRIFYHIYPIKNLSDSQISNLLIFKNISVDPYWVNKI